MQRRAFNLTHDRDLARGLPMELVLLLRSIDPVMRMMAVNYIMETRPRDDFLTALLKQFPIEEHGGICRGMRTYLKELMEDLAVLEQFKEAIAMALADYDNRASRG